MFGKKTETQSTGTVRSSNSLLHNSLVQGSKLEGKVKSENDFRIDGIFHGSLNCSARVIIGPTGEFKEQIDNLLQPSIWYLFFGFTSRPVVSPLHCNSGCCHEESSQYESHFLI